MTKTPRLRGGTGACLTLGLALLLGTPLPLIAQRVSRVAQPLYEEVMPEAERFGPAEGDPPVVRAYTTGPDGGDVLHGFVFLTSDLPPEQYGYSGPIEALVGMRLDGTLTGVRVTDYRESYMRSMGDFLRTPGFQEQFAGKHLGDPFQLWGDIEGISRVSISVRALSRGVRDAARRVANAYGLVDNVAAAPGVVIDPVGLSWFELRQVGVVQRFEITEPGEGSAGIAVAYIGNERLGRYFLGEPLYERALQSAERRGGAANIFLYAIDGSRLRLFTRDGWSIEQGGDTTAIDPGNVVSLGLPSGGIVSGEATMIGIMMVDSTVDMSRPATFTYDAGALGVHSVEYVSQEARRIMAEVEAAEAAAADEAAAEEEAAATETSAAATGDEPSGGATETAPAVDTEAAVRASPDSGASAPEMTVSEDALPERSGEDSPGTDIDSEPTNTAAAEADVPQLPLDFAVTEDESLMERTLAGASWTRVGIMMFVLALGTAAFFAKIPALRWTSLTVTLLVLGFYDGGFLSVSHITSGIWAGAGVFLRDIPLLLIVLFTVVTTLVWGRVFCGFLCPFGALQDLLDRFVPRSLKRPLPRAVHDRAVYLKYGVLALVVVPAALGSQVSIYQYVEPFGTVFFLSPSLLLWTIAGAFIVASVVVPRFYCRYACPLGAALGILSVVSLRRIRRVEQCTLCKVCEQTCPTGAIRGPEITFRECVRCNECEVALINKVGVCRHDMEDVRSRLVPLRLSSAGVGGERGVSAAAPSNGDEPRG
jgi:transcriptional regulator of nitric oxide reductase/ferredoxin